MPPRQVTPGVAAAQLVADASHGEGEAEQEVEVVGSGDEDEEQADEEDVPCLEPPLNWNEIQSVRL